MPRRFQKPPSNSATVYRPWGTLVRMAVVESELRADSEGRELAAALLALELERRRIEAEMAVLIACADESGVFVEDGHATVTAWAQATCNWSPAETKARTRLARLDGRMPSVVPALRCGRIGVAQAMELARLSANPRARHHLPDSEEVLVTQAGRLWYLDFQTVCRRWEALADENGAHRDHERARFDRRVHAGIVGTRFHLDAEGDVITGTAMAEILDRFEQAEFHADWDQARQQFGDAACAGLLERNASQRRFDALHAIFLTAADAPCAPRNGEPLVNLVVDAESFEHHLARYYDQPAVPLDPTTVLDRRCETTGGHPVDGRQAVAAALAGQVRRVIVDSTGRVIDLGRRRRLFTGAAREAVQLTDGRCTWPGCPMPAHRSHVDHSIEYSRDGPTRPDNGATMCLRHNLHKTRGYTTHRDQHGQWHIHRPDGTEIAPRRC